MKNFDTIVIGAGPGGTKCALELAKGGQKVALIEKNKVGGTCLNRGCIPSKTYLYLVELLESFKKAKRHGIEVEQPKVIWEKAKKRKDMNVRALGLALKKALECNKVEFIEAEAKIKDQNTVVAGEEELSAKNIVIAVGSQTLFLGSMAKSENIIGSTEILDLEEIPESLTIIGGGVIGVEMASIFLGLGSKVTIIELQSQLLPFIDADVSEEFKRILEKKGAEILLNTKVLEANDKGQAVEVKYLAEGSGGEGSSEIDSAAEESITASKVLVAIGRKANYNLEALATIGITNDGRKLEVAENYQTSLENIYVLGDAAFKNLTAYGAESEAVFCARQILSRASSEADHDEADHGKSPAVMPKIHNLMTIFSRPEIALIGLTEKMAKEKGVNYKVLQSTYGENAKALITGEREGMIKILVESESNIVLGVQILGSHACDLIHQATLAIDQQITVDTWLNTTWSHPVLSEIFKTALEGCHGK
jgi:dihydrolipoamide dehydrogenase